jgi:hypothetical protein
LDGEGPTLLRRVDPRTGEVLERLEMPPGVGVSGLESDGGDQFFCGGGRSGKVRAVHRPRRGSAGSRAVSTDVRNWTLFDIENWTPG